MGVGKIIKSVTGGLLGGIVGGAEKPKAATPVAAASTEVDQPTAAETEEDRRRRILALNGQGAAGQLTAAGGDPSQATTGRKALLGL